MDNLKFKYRHKEGWGGVIFLSCLLIILTLIKISRLFAVNELTLTIIDKNIKYGKDSSKYLIYCETEDKEIWVVENTDELWYGKFNSSDIYADLKVGETYRFKVIGFRVPFLSWYQNIVEYHLIT